jgi:NhaP-type Na+/H+ or K+/H+ antiporter
LPSSTGTTLVAWSGMRGAVTLAAALAMPALIRVLKVEDTAWTATRS